jgi:hypothetical protein
LSLYIRDNENIKHPSRRLATVLSSTQFSTLKSSGLYDPKGPEKYTTDVKYRQHLTAATQQLTPAVVLYQYMEKDDPFNIKIRIKFADSV